jgi:hypothetical protein
MLWKEGRKEGRKKGRKEEEHWWLMLAILAIWETEVGRIVV